MSAQGVLQAALLAALRGDATLAAGLNGVFAGPAVKASPPFAELGDTIAVDWGTKTERGRELRIAVTLRDAAETAVRLHGLAEAACAAIEALPRDLPGWRVASVALLRSRLVRAGVGQWTALVEYRARMMAV